MTILKKALYAEENNVVHSLMDFRDRMVQHLVHAKQFAQHMCYPAVTSHPSFFKEEKDSN